MAVRRVGARVRVIAGVCAAMALAVAAILVARGGRPVTPVSDTAVIESFTLYASRAELLVGPYSRYGWHHPGPLYFYLLAPVYTLSGRLTPGLSAGALLINIASIAVLTWVLARTAGTRLKPGNTERSAGRWLPLVISAFVAVYAWRVAPLLVSPWNPHVIVLPLAALIVVAAAVASGQIALLPLAVGLASLVMQTHLGVVPTTVAVLAAAVVAGWQAAREDAIARRRAVIGAAAVGAVLWAAPFAEQVTSTPGNMTAISRFFSASAREHQTMPAAYAAWSDMLAGVVRPDFRVAEGGPFRRSGWRPARTLAAIEVVALAVMALFAHRQRRRFEAAFASLLLLAIVVAFAAVTRIHDVIIDHEVFWISGLGALAAAACIAALVSVAWQYEPPGRMVAYAAVLSCAAAAYFALGELRIVTRRTFTPDPVRRAAAAIGDALERHVRSKSVRPLIQIDQEAWPVAAGAILHLQRSGLPFAVEDDWVVMFTDHARRTGDETEVIAIAGAQHLPVRSGGAGETIAGANRIYAVVVESTPGR